MEKRQNTKAFSFILNTFYDRKLKDNIISESSYLIYQRIITIFKNKAKFYNTPVQKITIKDIYDFKDEIIEYSNEVINKIWGALKSVFKIAYSRRIITYNILLDETLNKPFSKKHAPKIEALTVNEELNLIKALSESKNIQASACLLQLYTGARIGEILAIQKDCINLKANTLTIKRTISKNKDNNVYISEHTKGYKNSNGIDYGARTFTMRSEVRRIIVDLLNQKNQNINGMLFWDNKRNKIIPPSYPNIHLRVLNKNYKITNKPLHTHVLRHTFITRCIESGMNLKVLQYLVGHIRSSSITLDVYTSISKDFIKKEMKKIG